MAKVSKLDLDAVPSVNRQYVASWEFTQSHLDYYSIQWYYYTYTSDVKYDSSGKLISEGIWIQGSTSNSTTKRSTYTPPENASKIRVRVKPVSKKTKKSGNKTTYWWTGEWSSWKERNVTDNSFVPNAPNTPTITTDGTNVTFEVTGLADNVDSVMFEYADTYEGARYTGRQTVRKSYGSASWTLYGTAGHTYIARAKTINIVNKTVNGKTVQYQYESAFSAWSGGYSTIPETPIGLTVVANSVSSVSVHWDSVSGAKTYIIGYARNQEDLISMSGSYSSIQTSENVTSATITGIESGHVYYFRMAAVNESNGRSEWSNIATAILGTKPNPPTIWSSTVVVKKGEHINLYFVHNSADGSAMREYDIEIYQNGNHYTTIHEYNQNQDNYGELLDKTNVYSLDTSTFNDSDIITWRVRTIGVHPDYSEWSATKGFNVYEPPSISLGLYSGENYNNPLSIIDHFPLHIHGNAAPLSQNLINYNISIISNEDYDSGYDEYGETININAGDEIFSKSYNATNGNVIDIFLNPGDIDLENGMEYTIKCTGAFSSGLTAEIAIIFYVSWEDEQFLIDGVVDYNSDELSANIRPTCRVMYPSDIEEVMSQTDTEYYPGDIVVREKTGKNSATSFDSEFPDVCELISLVSVHHPFNAINIALDTDFSTTFDRQPVSSIRLIYYCKIYSYDTKTLLAESEVEKLFKVSIASDGKPYIDLPYIQFNFKLDKIISKEYIREVGSESNDVFVDIECVKKNDGSDSADFFNFPQISYRYHSRSDANPDLIPQNKIASETMTYNTILMGETNDGQIIVTSDAVLLFETRFIAPDNNASLAVYRRMANGKFVEIESGITNLYSHTTTDPHPSLDNAIYRITATSNITGAISYVDLPPYPIPETSIIIQWNEQWRSYDTEFEGSILGSNKSVLKLPYNIDVSENNSKDVNLINYIGRERPVGYYGTHLGETTTWNCEIPKSDVETLYQLRRLSIYMGNVYVREPSGLGYWAKIDVSWSQTHCEMTIPVTFNITPVEGGM